VELAGDELGHLVLGGGEDVGVGGEAPVGDDHQAPRLAQAPRARTRRGRAEGARYGQLGSLGAGS
jgi:hypothetical protein